MRFLVKLFKNIIKKQKKSDRKIEDYYEHISKSKNGEKLFYEDMMQWGKRENFQSNPELRETAKEYAESFEKRNSNLKLIGHIFTWMKQVRIGILIMFRLLMVILEDLKNEPVKLFL